jgi:PadR family transcriptional regulator, regulatory protein PadR
MMKTPKREIQAKLAKGLLDTIILELLKKEGMHGYQIITEIRKGFGISFGASTIYPLLGVLEKKGYVESAWNMNCERPRKTYKLTTEGKDMLSYTENSLKMICSSLITDKQTNIQTAPFVLA